VIRMIERRRLNLPAGAVTPLVLDWSRDPEWRSAVTAMEVDPAGPARPGQRIRETLRFAGLRFVTPTTITAADALSASFSGGGTTVRVRGRRTVVPEPDGCTVVLELDVRTAGLLAGLTPLLAPSYRRRFTAEADALVALVAPTQVTSSSVGSAESTSQA